MNEANGLNEVMFTSAAVLDLLLQIEELQDYTVGMSETPDGNLQLVVGQSVYLINGNESKTIQVEDEVVGEIEVTAEDAYNDLLNNSIEIDPNSEMDQFNDTDYIQSGIIKEIAKSLTLGGLIRFASKHLLR